MYFFVFPLAGISSCDQCEQLCVVETDSISCDCFSGYRLSPNGVSCYIDESMYMSSHQVLTMQLNVQYSFTYAAIQLKYVTQYHVVDYY